MRSFSLRQLFLCTALVSVIFGVAGMGFRQSGNHAGIVLGAVAAISCALPIVIVARPKRFSGAFKLAGGATFVAGMCVTLWLLSETPPIAMRERAARTAIMKVRSSFKPETLSSVQMYFFDPDRDHLKGYPHIEVSGAIGSREDADRLIEVLEESTSLKVENELVVR